MQALALILLSLAPFLLLLSSFTRHFASLYHCLMPSGQSNDIFFVSSTPFELSHFNITKRKYHLISWERFDFHAEDENSGWGTEAMVISFCRLLLIYIFLIPTLFTYFNVSFLFRVCVLLPFGVRRANHTKFHLNTQ